MLILIFFVFIVLNINLFDRDFDQRALDQLVVTAYEKYTVIFLTFKITVCLYNLVVSFRTRFFHANLVLPRTSGLKI